MISATQEDMEREFQGNAPYTTDWVESHLEQLRENLFQNKKVLFCFKEELERWLIG